MRLLIQYSYDKKDLAKQIIEIEATSKIQHVKISIIEADSSQKIYSFIALEQEICWEYSFYNIWVQSGDIGAFCYS